MQTVDPLQGEKKTIQAMDMPFQRWWNSEFFGKVDGK
jgi:hypothetical protein